MEPTKLTLRMNRAIRALAIPALVSWQSAVAGDAVDKNQFHLFNPTPTEHLRALNTDRPDKTESPYTVDAGHFQLEMDLATFDRDHDTASGADSVTERWAVAPINLKAGLSNHVDLQLIVETYNYVRTNDGAARSRTKQSGFGDITARLKVNLWGNDGGKTAFGVMPFVKVPTNRADLGNNAVEGGLILPLALDLGHGFSMGLMTEFDFIQNSTGGDYHAEFVNSVTVSHDIFGKLGGYAEFWSLASAEGNSDWQGTFDAGLTCGVTDRIQLDGGVSIGVTKSAPDVQPFVGLSIRF